MALVAIAAVVVGVAGAAVAVGSRPPAAAGGSGAPAAGASGPAGSGAPADLSGCATSKPASGAYAVSICLTAPANGASASGTVTVDATVDVTGKSPGVQRVAFTIDGGALLSTFVSAHSFQMDTTEWPDGAHVLTVHAQMRDSFVSQAAGIRVTFANGSAAHQSAASAGTSFRSVATAAGSGKPLVVAAAGDGASGEPGETSTVGQISSWNPNLFLYLGDVYENGRPTEFANWYGNPSSAGLYGRFRAITAPTIGNHEYVGTDASGYFGYWGGVPHYYSFDAGGWHFVSLDANLAYGQLTPDSPQYAWLEHDLAASTSPCTIAYFHEPFFNVGPEGSEEQLQPIWALLAQHHVTMVLNGHDHDYQRWAPLDGSGNASGHGITEFIVGSGGHGHQPQLTTDPRLVTSDFTDFGALKLSLYPVSATFQFVTSSGLVRDSGLIPCGGTTDTKAPSAPSGVTAGSDGPGKLALHWRAATDDVGVAGYEVFRDGSPRPTAVLAPDATSFVDTVAPSSSHSYALDAFDAAGNRSPRAGPVAATALGGTLTLSLDPAADTYVSQASPTANFGAGTVLRAGGGSQALVTYLRFDLSGVAGTVEKATLRVYANTAARSGLSAEGVTPQAWDESTVNASNAPAVSPSGAVASGPVAAGSWVSIDVSSLIPGTTHGPITIALAGGVTQVSMGSRESPNPPQLILTVGP